MKSAGLPLPLLPPLSSPTCTASRADCSTPGCQPARRGDSWSPSAPAPEEAPSRSPSKTLMLGWTGEGGQKSGQGAPQQAAFLTSSGSFAYHLQGKWVQAKNS